MSKTSETRLIAKRYAKALLNLAGNAAPDLAKNAKALQQACTQEDMVTFLNNPLLTRGQSAEVIETLLNKLAAPELLKQTIIRMAHNRRLSILPEMLEQFVQLVEADQGIIRVTITSAKELSKKDINQLTDKIAQHYNCKLSVKTEVNPALIGGVQLTMGDKQIDYSAFGKLERLRSHLKHSPIANKG